MVLHPYKQSECMLPFPTFLTSDDCRTVADDIYQKKKRCVAFLQQSRSLLPLPTFLTSDDFTSVADDIEQQNNCVASVDAVTVLAAIAHLSHRR